MVHGVKSQPVDMGLREAHRGSVIEDKAVPFRI